MKILILTGKFGMGHWSASQSLRLQLLAEDPNAEIEVEDFLAYAMPDVSEAMYKGFSLLVTHGSGIFNTYYKMTENMENEARPPFERLFLEKLEELLAAENPDMVIATHPLCAQLVSRHKWEPGSNLPLVTCITDLSVHSEWITGGTDCYLVGAGEMTQRLARKGVDPAKVIVTGIPVKPEFEATPRHRGGETRSLLIMGGGLGLMPKKDKFYEALNALPNLRTTIIAGSNKHLAERLAGKYENIQVVGYTDHVADYMANADLMLSKPGGITLFETIAAELPLLAWEPFLQQEINNARFLSRAGMGAIAAKETEDCLDAVERLIHNDGALAWMAGNMRRLKAEQEPAPLAAILNKLSAGKRVCA